MKTSTLLLRLLLYALALQAKHDGQLPDDDGDDDDKTSSASSTSLQLPASTSTVTVLSTSTFISVADTTTASSSTTASTASPSGALQFTPPANVTMCEPAVFTWEFNSSTSVPLTIMVTNERAVSSSSPNQAPLVERMISTSVDAKVCVVSWPHADVPEGAYSILAIDTAHTGTVSAQSSSFFVNAGSDTSCLNQKSSSSASASPTSASDTSNDTANPTSSASSPKSMSIGAIVGTIAGILVGVGGLLLVFSLPRLRRHIFRSETPQRPGGPYVLF